MDQTYAEIEHSCDQIPVASTVWTTPKNRQRSTRRSRNLRRNSFDSGLPIEYRYPKRNSMTSTISSKQRSLASKSSSSGYSSSSSVSSVVTMVNGPKPYRPEKKKKLNDNRLDPERSVCEVLLEPDTSMINIILGEDNGKEKDADNTPKSRACCIDCREKEIRHELDLESHQYANLKTLSKAQDPYVFLMTSMLTSLQKEGGGRKVGRVQQKIEKVLRMKPRELLNVGHKNTFDRQIATFAADVEIRLRAVSEVAPATYREVSAKFCDALHHDAPSSKSLKGIVKGVKSLLNF